MQHLQSSSINRPWMYRARPGLVIQIWFIRLFDRHCIIHNNVTCMLLARVINFSCLLCWVNWGAGKLMEAECCPSAQVSVPCFVKRCNSFHALSRSVQGTVRTCQNVCFDRIWQAPLGPPKCQSQRLCQTPRRVQNHCIGPCHHLKIARALPGPTISNLGATCDFLLSMVCRISSGRLGHAQHKPKGSSCTLPKSTGIDRERGSNTRGADCSSVSHDALSQSRKFWQLSNKWQPHHSLSRARLRQPPAGAWQRSRAAREEIWRAHCEKLFLRQTQLGSFLSFLSLVFTLHVNSLYLQ